MPKAYSQAEMKAIVSYINENKLYSEIRGRKMWVDFANTGLVARTWQSMKETFLKRILSDIHNPYYGLTVMQIQSFRQGQDVEKKHARLEIQTIGSSSSNEEDKRDKIEPKSRKENEKKITGEDITCSKIENQNRSSTETLVLEKYETAEEIQKILESDDDAKANKTPKKSLKDCIVYSQPLTPMLQAVVDDFSTDDEPPMQIVEDALEKNATQDLTEDTNKDKNQLPVDISNTKDPKNDETIMDSNTTNKADSGNKSQTVKVKSLKLRKTRKGNWKNDDGTDSDATSVSDSKTKRVVESNKENPKEKSSLENFINDTPDSVLPNNQEGIYNIFTDKRNSNESVSDAKTNSENMVIETELRKSDVTENAEPQHNNPTTEVGPLVNDDIEKAQDINPCLKSVSLFEEQFRIHSNSNSDVESHNKSMDNDIETNETNVDVQAKSFTNIDKSGKPDNVNAVTNDGKVTNKKQGDDDTKQTDVNMNNKTEKKKDDFNHVVLLKSHSDSDSEVFEPPSKKVNKNVPKYNKEEKSNAIASILGFSSGRTRKRTVSHRETSHRRRSAPRRTLSRHSRHRERSSQSSDESSTISENDDYSPPHKSRRYVKPRSYDIMAFPGERGLFVMERKKIYPIVRQCKNLKGFVTLSGDEVDDSEENTSASYWKAKYMEEQKRLAEEKIRCEEMKRMLRAKEQQVQETLNKQENLQKVAISSSSEEVRRKEESPQVDNEENNGRNNPTVKIKVNKDHEIELECKWMQLNPILEKITHLFHKPTISEPEAVPSERVSSDAVLISSGKSTPLDEEVHEKVDKIEGEIFKEIAELEKSAAESSPRVENVTQRKRGRPKKVSAASTTSLTVSADKSTNEPVIETEKPEQNVGNVSKTDAKQNSPTKEVRPQRNRSRNRKYAIEYVEDLKSKDSKASKNTPKKRSRSPKSDITSKSTKSPGRTSNLSAKSPRKVRSRSSSKLEVNIPDDEGVLYKFPAARGRPRKTDRVDSVSYVTRPPSPESASLNSVDSTLGYQDSDVSPTSIVVRRKKKFNLPNTLHRGREFRSRTRRRSYPYLASHDSYERHKTLKASTKISRTSSLDTAVYQSDSYDLLMNKVRSSFNKLDKIDEHSASASNNMETSTYFTPEPMVTVDANDKNLNVSNANSKTEGNSSNVTLPTSPALSIVEKISISKDTISSLEISHPTINETLGNEDVTMKTDPNKYLISDVDISVPLMEQDCEVYERNTTADKPKSNEGAVADSLINKMDITIQSQTGDLHVKLQQLLLESSKKVQKQQALYKETVMEIDPEPVQETKRLKSKRCSTPHKKRSKRKSKVASVEPVVEEYTESCRAGRQSCPPVINIIHCDENIVTPEIISAEPSNKSKARKKKDIIKVKIQKPKDKNISLRPRKLKRPKSDSRLSINATKDSESGICLQVSDDSVDLIHNHSETCLHVNECVNDSSLEVIEKSSDGLVLINSSASDDNRSCYEENKCENAGLPETFCCNAQDASNFVVKPHIKDIETQSCETVYHTPKSDGSLNSLMTEDLSDASPPPVRPKLSNWHLLSEEETKDNCNDVNANETGTYVFSNLNQIFPITCAVPDLSTITENTESNSRRPTNEKPDSSSEVIGSIFDTIF